MIRSIVFAAVPTFVVGLLFPAGGESPSLPPESVPVWQITPHGQIAFIPLKTSPFPHESRKEGLQGKTTQIPYAGHYDDSTVGFVIPPGYAPNKQVDLIVHFHGHNNRVAKELREFKFAEMLEASGKNAILLLPQGPRDAADSSGGRLEERGALKPFVEEAIAILVAAGKVPQGATVRHLVLSGHSGGYRVIAYCLRHGGMEGHVRAVWLWDATYDKLEDYAAWLARPRLGQSAIESLLATPTPADPSERTPEGTPGSIVNSESPSTSDSLNHPSSNGVAHTGDSTVSKRFFLSIFTAHLAENNAVLMALAQKLSVPYGVWQDFDFNSAVRSPVDAHFVATTLEHNDVMTKGAFFQKVLAASNFLDPRT